MGMANVLTHAGLQRMASWDGHWVDACWSAENGFMGMGIGAAMTGLRPIVEGMNMGFLLLAYNQISNNAGMLHYTSGGQYKVGCPTASSYICCACLPLPTLFRQGVQPVESACLPTLLHRL